MLLARQLQTAVVLAGNHNLLDGLRLTQCLAQCFYVFFEDAMHLMWQWCVAARAVLASIMLVPLVVAQHALHAADSQAPRGGTTGNCSCAYSSVQLSSMLGVAVGACQGRCVARQAFTCTHIADDIVFDKLSLLLICVCNSTAVAC
jgi:hypothetical protein